MIALLLSVHGRVQRVWYRDWTVQNARELGLTGWVKNEPDGSVSALLQGEEPIVRQMIERMRDGPPHALVDRIEEQQVEAADLAGFNRR